MDKMLNTKWSLKVWMWGCELDSSGLGQGPVAGTCELVMKVIYRWGILDQHLNHYLLWKDSATGGLFSESTTPELMLLLFAQTCVITIWKEAHTLHIIKIIRASATVEWRYTSTLPDVFTTCTVTALQLVCQVAKEIQASLILCQGLCSC
jgi:hypothetical protein